MVRDPETHWHTVTVTALHWLVDLNIRNASAPVLQTQAASGAPPQPGRSRGVWPGLVTAANRVSSTRRRLGRQTRTVLRVSRLSNAYHRVKRVGHKGAGVSTLFWARSEFTRVVLL